MKKQFRIVTIHKHSGALSDIMRLISAQNSGELPVCIEDIISFVHLMKLFYPITYKNLSIERGEDGMFWLLEEKERLITIQEIELHELEGIGALAE